MYGCTGVQVPPPFIHFIPMLWAVLACVAILPTTGKPAVGVGELIAGAGGY